MPADTLSITILAELSDLKKQLGEVSDLGKSEIDDMVKGIQRSLKNAEKAAKRTSDAEKLVAERAKNASESAKKAATLVGGEFAKAGEIVFELGPKLAGLAGSFGPLILAAGGLTGAVVAVGAAAIATLNHIESLADDGVKAAAALESSWEKVSPEKQIEKLRQFDGPLRAIHEYEDAIASMEEKRHEAALSAGADNYEVALGWKKWKEDTWDAITNGLGAAFSDFLSFTAPGVLDFFRDLGREALDSNRVILHTAQLFNNMPGFTVQNVKMTEQAAEELRKKLIESNAKLREDEERLRKKDAEDRKREHDAELREQEAANQKLLDQFDGALRQIAMNRIAAHKAEIAEEQRIEKEYDKFLIAEANQRMALWKDVEAARQEMARTTGDLLKDFAVEAAAAYTDLVNQSTDDTIASYETRARAGERFTEAETQAYEQAKMQRRTAAIVEIVAQAAVAYASLVANLAPLLGPGAFVAAAAMVGVGLIAPLTAILGESIPFDASGGASAAEGYQYSSGSSGSSSSYSHEDYDPGFFERLYNSVLGRGGVDENGDGKVTDKERNNRGSKASTSRSSGGGTVTVVLDPSLQRLRVTEAYPGKSQRGRR